MKIVTAASKDQILDIVRLLAEEDRVLTVDEISVAMSIQKKEGLLAVNEDSQAVGFIRFIDWGISPELQKHVFELGSWVVAPSERGKGVGKKLLHEIVRHIKSLHPNSLIVDITRKSNDETCTILENLHAKDIAKPDCIELYPKGADENLFRFFDLSDLI